MTSKRTGRPVVGPMLRLVLWASAALSPLAGWHLKRRLARGKEDPDRWREKLGQTDAARPDGPLVWLHGVGLGEVMALRGLIVAMADARPDLSFLVTSSARSSGQVIARNLPPRTQHQYLPLDFPKPVAAFLDHWRPDLAVWTDQELWPRLAVTAARRGIPQALVAARLTAASAAAKARFGRAFGDLYALLDLRHAQDDATANHLRDLSGAEVTVTSTLKAAAAPLAVDDALLAQITKDADRRIWVAASAHRADVAVALAAQCQMPDNSLLIIAPRALDDAHATAQACDAAGLTHCTRSAGDKPDASCRVFIADSFGELGTWYRAADAALIGGTFDATQGHNPWEAVALGCAVLHGPNVANFTRDFAQLNASDAARPIADADALKDALADPALPDMVAAASAVREDAAAAMNQTTKALIGLLPNKAAHG